jgi:hypothetical protein
MNATSIVRNKSPAVAITRAVTGAFGIVTAVRHRQGRRTRGTGFGEERPAGTEDELHVGTKVVAAHLVVV